MEEEELLSTTECAELKGVKRQTVIAAIERGALKARRIGKSYVIKRQDCDAYEPQMNVADRGRTGAKKRWGEKPKD